MLLEPIDQLFSMREKQSIDIVPEFKALDGEGDGLVLGRGAHLVDQGEFTREFGAHAKVVWVGGGVFGLFGAHLVDCREEERENKKRV